MHFQVVKAMMLLVVGATEFDIADQERTRELYSMSDFSHWA